VGGGVTAFLTPLCIKIPKIKLQTSENILIIYFQEIFMNFVMFRNL